ncbi:exodeoxyribonuclease III [Cryptococcus sp. DSM 104549]
MRIVTWNVNVLRTCLDYHPFSSMKKKNVEGLLDELDAQIFCFQEHKTPRVKLEKSMACPGPYDSFWTFPHSKTGYSGVCTYVDSRYCVPLKAEEGITGLLLGDRTSTMRPPWTEAERVGCYPEVDDMEWADEVDGGKFEVKRLDMEGRAVVCDFGLFVLFNLYCPNETNDTRRPYKMNFLHALQERVRLLQAAGREVIIVGDINIVRAPIDSGEGPVRSSAAQHYEHPARRILDDWCAPKGPMIDVVRESWPERDDMFTCWNQKLDARPANYGSRIDMILCTPGLRPWIKGGDILPKVYGSDHCPVYADLHESITLPSGEVLHLRDLLNPKDRPPSTAPIYPNAAKREAPEPPRFATKFLDEFSGRQTSLKTFFGGGGGGGAVKKAKGKEREGVVDKLGSTSASASPAPTLVSETATVEGTPGPAVPAPVDPTSLTPQESTAAPFSVARAAFDALDALTQSSTSDLPSHPSTSSSAPRKRPREEPIDMTEDDDDVPSASSRSTPVVPSKAKAAKPKPKSAKTSSSSAQTKLSSFFAQPPTKAKRKSPPSSSSQPTNSKRPSLPAPSPSPSSPSSSSTLPTQQPPTQGLTEEEDLLISQALAEADSEQAAKKAQAGTQWSSLFAKKLPPLCAVHQKECKDFIVMKPGPNKGKRFWLCSMPVGAGYDSGRATRPRNEVNNQFRCNFFLWDSANSRKETPGDGGGS